MKLSDIINESYVVIDPRGNARPVGSKMQGAMYTKKMGGPKKGYHIVLAKNAMKARRAIEKNGGNATNSKIQNIMFDLMYEETVNEKKKNPGLWANMHAKRKRGEKSDPRSKAYKRAKKAGQKINRESIEEIIVREQDYQCFFEWLSDYSKVIQEAEYQGKKVELGKVKRGGDKKFYVYAKNPKGNIVKVSFGDTSGLSIKTKDPDRRKSFRARHKCDTNPGPKHKARYWSCRMWSGPDAVKNMLKK